MEKIRPTQIRLQAWNALTGKWNASALVALVLILITIIVRSLTTVLISHVWAQSLIYVAIAVLIAPLTVAYLFSMQDVLLRSVKPDIGDLFSLNKYYGRYLTGAILITIFTFLWTLLLIVPGIIKSLSYSMTYYIMRDNPELSALDAIAESQKMMKGHKMELFLLQLSFMGWVLLAIITIMIGMLWLMPYMYTAQAVFYEKLKSENNSVVAEA